jgi:hypothetical protein
MNEDNARFICTEQTSQRRVSRLVRTNRESMSHNIKGTCHAQTAAQALAVDCSPQARSLSTYLLPPRFFPKYLP